MCVILVCVRGGASAERKATNILQSRYVTVSLVSHVTSLSGSCGVYPRGGKNPCWYCCFFIATVSQPKMFWFDIINKLNSAI